MRINPVRREKLRRYFNKSRKYALSKSLEDDDDQLPELPKRRKYHYSS
ncbi:hypothetical protein OROHE_003046 [Orobanche hederae]